MTTTPMTKAKRNRWKLGAALSAVVAVPAGLFGLRFGYEHTSYNVEAELAAFEVRRYEPRIVAEVTITGGDSKRASSRGFRILADYIFGNNVDNKSIAMTTPVDQQSSRTIAMTTPVDVSGESSSWKVRFTMPSEYSLEELPTPVDPRVTLRPLAGARVAATRFAGVADAAAFESRYNALRLAVNDAGYAVNGEASPTFAQYDPPWTPGLLRRNEVIVELAR